MDHPKAEHQFFLKRKCKVKYPNVLNLNHLMHNVPNWSGAKILLFLITICFPQLVASDMTASGLDIIKVLTAWNYGTWVIWNEIINPFLTKVLIWYPLKRLENLWFSSVFRGCEVGTLARNGLNAKKCHHLIFYARNQISHIINFWNIAKFWYLVNS